MSQKRLFAENVLNLVGNTPLLRLKKITEGRDVEVYVKPEFMNPMGSIKDRIAKYMIEKAECDGRIFPGGTVIDNSSGNTALGLAMVCSQKAYHLKIVVRDSLSPEKIRFLQAMNVDIIKVDGTLPPESPDSYNNITPRLAAEIPGALYLDQHNSPDNNESHYMTTGPEIWEQMEGKIDYFVAGIGTGGTICGVARFLKERDPSIRIVGVDPIGSVFYDYFRSGKRINPSPYLLEGLGDEFIIGCVDFSLIDDMIQVADNQAFMMTRRLALVEGILAGGSSGAAVWAVLKLAGGLRKKARIVTILPDSANRYLSTIYNDEWLKEKGVFQPFSK